MPTVSYIANGFCQSPTEHDRRRGLSELRLWNPTAAKTAVRMRVYYAGRPPMDIPVLELEPYANPLLVFPDHHPEAFAEVGPWGMRLVSDTVLVCDHILVAGHAAKDDPVKGDDVSTVQLIAGYFGPPDRTQYAGGVNDSLSHPRLSNIWHFADGNLIRTDPERPPFPFSEFEWYHILNPGPREARVEMHRYYGSRSHDVLAYQVGPERVLHFSSYDPDWPSGGFGIRFDSTEPVCVESERFIYGLEGMDEWGAHIHMSRPGAPGPLEWNEHII